MRASLDRLIYHDRHGVSRALIEAGGLQMTDQDLPTTSLLWLGYCSPQPTSKTPGFIPFEKILWSEDAGDGIISVAYVEDHAVVMKKVAIEGTDAAEVLSHAYGNIPREQRVLVVVNPHGGQGNAVDIYRSKVLPVLRAAHAQVTYMETLRAEHAIEIAQQLDIDLYDIVACCSGDGIPHEIINGLYQRPDRAKAFAQLAITQLPCGSGNAMTLLTHATTNAVDATLSMLKLSRISADAMAVTQLDLSGREVTKLSFLSQTYGVIADADIGTEHLRWMGAARFDLGVAKGILCRTSYPCEFAVEYAESSKKGILTQFAAAKGEQPQWLAPEESQFNRDGPALSAPIPTLWKHIENSDKLNVMYTGKFPYVSKDVMIFPTAHPADGAMDLFVTDTTMSIWEMNKMFGLVETGGQFFHDRVHYLKISKYRLTPQVKGKHYFSVDGESFPLEPVQVEVLPRVLTLLVPQLGFNNKKFSH